jgi:tryptophan 2,3-dioxygenase
MECPFNGAQKPEYYGDYLAIDELLKLQRPLSLERSNLLAHDEMLFIIIHQAYELWFKQILHELQACRQVLSKPAADDDGPDMNVVVQRLKRIVEIWKLLNHQVDVLETMTPLDFLEFREHLHGASGFQSKQFRQIEATLGLRMESRFRPDYYKHTELGGFNEKDFAEISEWEKQPSLLVMVERWLARAPFFDEPFWSEWQEAEAQAAAEGQSPFWTRYRAIFESSLSDRDDKPETLGRFDEIFFTTGWGDFSPDALRTALFIMLYRDEPLFRLPVRVAEWIDRDRRAARHVPLPASADGAADDRHARRHRRQQRRAIPARRGEQELRLQGTGGRDHLSDRAPQAAGAAETAAQGAAV